MSRNLSGKSGFTESELSAVEQRRRQARKLFWDNRFRLWAGILAIFALVFIVYRPVLPGSFLMDDERLTGGDNPLVNGSLTPRSLWFQADFTLASFGWWLEHMVFKQNPLGYHVVNVLLQGLSALLLWRLLIRLKIPGAWLAAAVYAVHPVCVNSVARVAELKNTLSMPFYLLSFWAWLHYEAGSLYPDTANRSADGVAASRRRATIWLAVALIAFVMALLAKTTAVMLPFVILFCAAWQRGRVTRKDLLHVAPFLALSLAFGLMSIWFQSHQAMTETALTIQPASFWQRLAASGCDFWFYLGKGLLPFDLSLVYFRTPVNAHLVSAYFPLLLIFAIFLLCWQYRRTWGRHALFGLGCFGVTLLPVLGFFDAQFLTMWRVSDHLQYKPLAAIVVLAIASLAALPWKRVFYGLGGAMLLVFACLSLNRARVFSTEESLVRDTLKKNPMAWAAHNDLGVILAKQNDFRGAIREFRLSLQLFPDNLDARMNLGHALVVSGKFSAAEHQFTRGLKTNPHAAQMHKAYAESLRLQGRHREAFHHLRMAALFKPDPDTDMELASWLYESGEQAEAVEQFRRVLKIHPGHAEALNGLAWILATAPDNRLRDGREAVQCARQACRATAFSQPEMISVLAAAYAESGDFNKAVSAAGTAIRMENAAGDARSAAINRQLLAFYQSGRPFREYPAPAQADAPGAAP